MPEEKKRRSAKRRKGERPLFYDNGYGWLGYRPFRKHLLPDLVRVTDADGEPVKVKIKEKTGGRRSTVSRTREKDLYEIAWPGRVGDMAALKEEVRKGTDPALPRVFTRHWPRSTKSEEKPLSRLLSEGLMPDEPPEALAYHLAVNYEAYGDKVLYPVAGLPAARVQEVLSRRFIVSKRALPAIAHLKWLAESHWGLPMFDPFDTAVRDTLCGVSLEATRLYFYLIGDYGFNETNEYYARHFEWHRFACYLFWVGRTGMGLYANHADIDVEDEMFVKDFPDVVERMAAWDDGGYSRARSVAHVQGRDPAVAFAKIVSGKTPKAVKLDGLPVPRK